jgi:hypothetical protein
MHAVDRRGVVHVHAVGSADLPCHLTPQPRNPREHLIFQVRDFEVVDAVSYPVTASWDKDGEVVTQVGRFALLRCAFGVCNVCDFCARARVCVCVSGLCTCKLPQLTRTDSTANRLHHRPSSSAAAPSPPPSPSPSCGRRPLPSSWRTRRRRSCRRATRGSWGPTPSGPSR